MGGRILLFGCMNVLSENYVGKMKLTGDHEYFMLAVSMSKIWDNVISLLASCPHASEDLHGGGERSL